MRPRTQKELTEHLREVINTYLKDHPVATKSQLTDLLSKELHKLTAGPRRPAFEMGVVAMDGDILTVQVKLNDQRLIELLDDAQGKLCPSCEGMGTVNDITQYHEVIDVVCDQCKGLGAIPF